MELRDKHGRLLKGTTAYNKGVYGEKRRRYEQGLDIECMHHGMHNNWYYAPESNALTCRFCASVRTKKYMNKEENTFKVFYKWAKRRQKECTITIEYIEELFNLQDGFCAISGIKIDRRNMSLDRINSTIGYVEGNVQWVHKKINQMKSNFDENEFIEMCNKVANYNILKPIIALSSARAGKKK